MNALASLFDWLLSVSFRASVLVLAIVALQFALRRWLGPRARYALWLPVLVVVLTPVFPQSRWSVPSAFARLPEARNKPLPLSEVAVVVASSSNAAVTAPGHVASVGIDWSRRIPQLWFCGTALILGVLGFSYARTLRGYRNSRLPVDETLIAQITAVADEIGLQRIPRVWMSASAHSPAVAGLLKPVLLLPATFDQQFTDSEARLILQHELTHLRRQDLPLNALMCLLMALHWFNPVLWLAFFRIRTDREVACDFQVLQHGTPRLRSEYGHTLLKMESAFAHPRLGLGFVGIFQRGAALRSRIRFIAAKRRPHPAMKWVTPACIGFLTFFGITRATGGTDEKPSIILEAKFVEITGKRNDPLSAEKVFAGVFEGVPGMSPTGGAMRGVLDEAQFQTAIRALSQKKGVDLVAAPQLTTLPGQKAHVEVTRDFQAPRNKAQFLEKKVGVMLDVLPSLGEDGAIKIAMSPQIVEFEGFVKDATGGDKPVFSERKAETSATLTPGQTAVLDLGDKTDTQQVGEEDEGKVMHWTTDHFTRRAFVFITARMVKPAPKKTGGSRPAKPAYPEQSRPDKTSEKNDPAKLRAAKAVRYTFSKAVLGDVLRFIASEAALRFISVPEDHPASSKLVTFDVEESPFQALETICRANGLTLVLNGDVWYVRAIDDAELIGKAYPKPKAVPTESVLADIRSVLDTDAKTAAAGGGKVNASKEGVSYKVGEDYFYVTATRLHHSWVEAYFKGLGRGK